MNNLGIYVHIPFCKKKCNYCDFISFPCKDHLIENYFIALEKEIDNFNIENREISTIYIGGGGTPSYPDSKYIIEILETIKNNYLLTADCEITIEVNPGTVNKEKLLSYKNAGFNRLSIGLQTTSNRLLKLIGRIHTYEDFLETYERSKNLRIY